MNDERELMEKYFEGGLTAEEETRLSNWLGAEREHLRVFIREAHLHRQLRAIMAARPFYAGQADSVREKRRYSFHATIDSMMLAWRRAWLPVTACVAVAMVVGIWLLFPTFGQPVLAEVHGDGLTILRGGQSLAAVAGMRLLKADILRTGPSGTAEISFAPEGTRLILQPATELTLAGVASGKRFDLRSGKLEASVARQPLFRPLRLTTSQAEARVVGTRFSLLASSNATRLDVMEGKVRLTRRSDRATVAVGAGCYATVADRTELAALPFTGGILREFWNGIGDKTIQEFRSDPRYRARPGGAEIVRAVELQSVTTNNMLFRFAGYVHPPVTGDYEFWLSGASDAALYMSPGESPAEEVCMATSVDYSRKLDKPRFQGASPYAPPMRLVAGRRYYFEAIVLIKQGEGHLSVAWRRQGEPRELLTGEFLSPYKPRK